ncbi:Na+/H+ antiporter subunit E [Rariglobus hedericola]|uniref:Sodium:proton antiporter n=1 Tax=Rariglobus hedericola TaxID=2597822 RepID=A0A556QP18_9BACT|nr:Na+/H+ antiporter subunit E [Rariglobus hedericola]TSJ78383.1 sodium:proton antiporter [Rariglobus hedericola]
MSTAKEHPRHSWPSRAIGFAAFLFHFARELVLANIAVAKSVLFQPVSALVPDFISYPLDGLSDFEIVVLTHCITLTPGTTSVEVSEDRTTLVVHALDARDPQGVCDGIKKTLETPILAWTR